MARRVGDDRGGAWRLLGLLGLRIGLQRQQLAVGAVDLVFVEVARPQPRHEQLPKAARRRGGRIGMRRPSQPLKSPTTLTALRIGRPDRKGHPLDAFVLDRMGAELAVAREMVAFAEQVKVELAQNRREAVDVVEFAGRRRRPTTRSR